MKRKMKYICFVCRRRFKTPLDRKDHLLGIGKYRGGKCSTKAMDTLANLSDQVFKKIKES